MRRREYFYLTVLVTFITIINIPMGMYAQQSGASWDTARTSWQKWDHDIRSDNTDRTPKSPKVALRKAFLHTGVPLAAGIILNDPEIVKDNLVNTAGALMIGYGLVYGPSKGNFYANDFERGMTGIGIRLGSAGLMLAYTTFIYTQTLINFSGEKNGKGETGYYIMSGVSILAFTGSTIYNLASAKKSAREYNEKYDLDLSFNLERLPYINKSTPVLTVRINF